MKNTRDRTIELGFGIVGSLIATAVTVVLRFINGSPIENWEMPLLLFGWLIFVLAAFALFYLPGKLALRTYIKPAMEKELRESLRRDLAEETESKIWSRLTQEIGLVEIFPGFPSCQDEILETLRDSQKINIFLQIGRTVLRGGANFYDKLAENIREDAYVKILHSRSTSPYLSERSAFNRPGGGKKKYEEWRVELDYAVRRMENLAKDHFADSVESRQHDEGFLWRLFLFDNDAFVQPYLFPRNNSNQAPVLKFQRTHQGTMEPINTSLYQCFQNFFDLKWEENLPIAQRLDELIPSDHQSVVAAVVRYHQFFIFAIPSRYIEANGPELPFHGIGGKRRPGEGWLAALQREIGEEIQSQVEIVSSSSTRYLTTGAELEAVGIKDDPRPYCIYKRTRQEDPNFHHPEVLWLVAYDCKVKTASLDNIRPGSEIGALVILTGEMLKRSLHGSITYEDLSRASDGSRLVLAGDVKIDSSKRAVPAGLATIVAADYPARFMQRL